jgi:DNA-binding response OmpR family regulator
MRNQGTTLTRNMLLEHVWDMNADPFTNTVDVHIRFLRAKIDEGHKKKLLKTVHGYGYKIEE